jgi:hypothetical protein
MDSVGFEDEEASMVPRARKKLDVPKMAKSRPFKG